MPSTKTMSQTVHDRATRESPIEVVILRDVLSDNVAVLKRFVGDSTKVMIMVKANGFGHGTALAAKAAVAGGAEWLGVATPDEAMIAVEAGVPVLNVGWTPPDRYRDLIEAGVDMAVFDAATLTELARAGEAVGRMPRVQIKIDSGMHRLGVPLLDIELLADALRRNAGRLLVTGIYTHFANADHEDLTATIRQHDLFMEAVSVLRADAPEAAIHCSNSAAGLRCAGFNHDIVRFGIAAYGYAPPHATGIVSLRGAMRVSTRIARIETVAAGSAVGYGSTWSADCPRRIATICGGYADGIGRYQSNRGVVLIGGQRCPIIGRVSMSFTTVDLEEWDGARVGHEVVLIGEQNGIVLGADEIADGTGTIPNEILCCIAPLVSRGLG